MSTANLQTLLNINAAAKNLQKDYKGSLISLDRGSVLFQRKPMVSGNQVNLTKVVMDTFHSLASPPNFLWADINTLMGFLVDAEAVFEVSTSKPVGPIQELSLLGRESMPENSAPGKPIPDGAKRVAVLSVTFSEALFGTHDRLSGLTNLKKRLLEARGYSVLIVSQNEFGLLKQKLPKVKLLSAKLNALMK